MAEQRNENGTFRPGVSGNVNGRPKKGSEKARFPQHFRDMIREVGEEKITLTRGGEEITLSAAKAILLTLRNKALTGHVPSLRLYLQLSMDNAEHEWRHILGMLHWKDIAGEVLEENKELRAKIPKRQTNGVVHYTPSPTSPLSSYRGPGDQGGEQN